MDAKTLTLVERLMFDIVVAAYLRGADWARNNPDDLVMINKAACDYADKMSSEPKSAPRELISLLEAARKALEPFALTLGAMEKRAPGFHEVQPDNRALDIEVCYGTIRLARSVHSKLKGEAS